jgi:hypothetical protein
LIHKEIKINAPYVPITDEKTINVLHDKYPLPVDKNKITFYSGLPDSVLILIQNDTK